MDSARKFSEKSHLPDAVPHVFKATIHRDDILLSHHSRKEIPFIPEEDALHGKKEYIALGNKLKNIERIE